MEIILKNVPPRLYWFLFLLIIILISALFLGYKVQWDSNGNFRGVGLDTSIFSEHGNSHFEMNQCGSHADPCVIEFSQEFSSSPVCIISELNPDGTGYSQSVIIKETTESGFKVVSGDSRNMYFNWFCG